MKNQIGPTSWVLYIKFPSLKILLQIIFVDLQRQSTCAQLPPPPPIPTADQPGQLVYDLNLHPASDSRARGPGFDTRFGHILSFLLPLIEEGQLSVTVESMCTKYWLTAK